MVQTAVEYLSHFYDFFLNDVCTFKSIHEMWKYIIVHVQATILSHSILAWNHIWKYGQYYIFTGPWRFKGHYDSCISSVLLNNEDSKWIFKTELNLTNISRL